MPINKIKKENTEVEASYPSSPISGVLIPTNLTLRIP